LKCKGTKIFAFLEVVFKNGRDTWHVIRGTWYVTRFT